MSFLVVDKQSQLVERPTARVWISRGLKQAPFAASDGAARADRRPGRRPGGCRWDLRRDDEGIDARDVLVPRGAGRWHARSRHSATIVVRKRSAAPAVGDRAISSDTPTLASTGGDLAALTTSRTAGPRAVPGVAWHRRWTRTRRLSLSFATPAVLPVPDVRARGRHGLRRAEAAGSPAGSASSTSRSTGATTRPRASTGG